jgi:hypothetical protein
MAPRVGRNNIIFKMVKLRSMVSNADSSGVGSTSANDSRITHHFTNIINITVANKYIHWQHNTLLKKSISIWQYLIESQLCELVYC